MSRALRASLLVIAVSTLAGLAGFILRPRPSPPDPPPPVPAPTADAATRLFALSLPDPAGREQSMAQWKGKVLVVNFWATWCPPCLDEMPEFSAISNELSEKNVQFVGISIDSADKINEFLTRTPITYPLLIGNAEALALSGDFGNRAKGLPFTVVLRPDGTAQEAKLGKFAAADLKDAVRAALRAR